MRRAAPEAPVHAHSGSGGDVRPVSTVPRDADELYRSLPRTPPPQETFAKVAYVPSATTGAVPFDEMGANAAGAGRGRGKAPGQREVLTRPGFPGSAEEMSQVTGMPVPLTYADVAGNPFVERDVRPKIGRAHV